jgi:hypothetical protein
LSKQGNNGENLKQKRCWPSEGVTLTYKHYLDLIVLYVKSLKGLQIKVLSFLTKTAGASFTMLLSLCKISDTKIT